MRKHINGRCYDTEKATEIGEWDNGLANCNDRWVVKTLYRKRNGEFFLHGQGGASTSYGVRVAEDDWMDGEQIIPLSDGAARKWADEHLSVEEIESAWGNTPKEQRENINVWVSARTKMELKALCAKHCATQGDVVETAIGLYYEREF